MKSFLLSVLYKVVSKGVGVQVMQGEKFKL